MPACALMGRPMLVLHCAYVSKSQSQDNAADELTRADSPSDTSNRDDFATALLCACTCINSLSAAAERPCWALQSILDMYAGICLACYCDLHQASLPLQPCGYTIQKP